MTDRPYNTAVFLIRCLELGLHPSDLSMFEYGTVLDMLIEKGNDNCEWNILASQEDFDRF